MLKIRKIDRYSIHSLFDLEDIQNMLLAFQKTFTNKQLSEIGNAQIDLKIFQSKKKAIEK
ncbi:hypothetical protein H1P_1200001 [Hyella patelloides LEGE 07179]|uniref:Uncharacterized protein n=1 Tax=Hyella patelloides LEGE 07179 TaxID=945734 RepID=A0A563VK53_9CYAN|nr:hypothetical protein [Hyella patelloides]VEP11788.1 hypothetical protein H1P_1200001 [Hyella patelloides LEGE 07179]